MIEWKHTLQLLPWLLGLGLMAWYFEIKWLLFLVNIVSLILICFSWPDRKK
jgi:hypothetical protein